MPFDRKQWEKANTELISVRLQKTTDADILDYLRGKSKQTEIKKALRERIKRNAGQRKKAVGMKEKALSAPGQAYETRGYLYRIDGGKLTRENKSTGAVDVLE